jgi:hypothetical protein
MLGDHSLLRRQAYFTKKYLVLEFAKDDLALQLKRAANGS